MWDWGIEDQVAMYGAEPVRTSDTTPSAERMQEDGVAFFPILLTKGLKILSVGVGDWLQKRVLLHFVHVLPSLTSSAVRL